MTSLRCSFVQIIKFELLRAKRGFAGISLKAKLLPTKVSTSLSPINTFSWPNTFFASSFESTRMEIDRSLLSVCFLGGGCGDKSNRLFDLGFFEIT